MYDVIVLGLGAMGSAATYEIARAGASVLGLEQFGPFHDLGSSHGRTRMIRKAYMEGEVYLPLLERAYEKWLALDGFDRRPVINLCGGLYIGKPSEDIIAGTLQVAKSYNLPLEHLSADQITKRFPAFKPDKDMVGLYDPEAGYVNPAGIFSFYHRQAKEHGADLHFHEKVERIEIGKKSIRVISDKGDYEGKKLIVAAGAWLGKLATDLGVTMPLEIRQMILNWFEPEGPPSNFKPGPFVPNLWVLDGGQIIYGFPWTEEEEGVKYAFHNRFRVIDDPDTANRAVGKADARDLWQALAKYVPNAAKTLLKSKVCFYTMTPDERFLLGRLPGHENILVAGGFSGHGFKFVPVVGEVMKQLALEGTSKYDISAFDPGRFQ